MYKALLVKANTHWGFSIREPGFTAASPSLPLPPPTTIVGALAASYAKLKELPEVINGRSTAAILLQKGYVAYALAGFINGKTTLQQDLTRILIIMYQKRKTPNHWFAAHAIGKTYAIGELLMMYIVRNDIAESLSKAAWGITRVGTRESLITVKEVKVLDIEKLDKKIINTPFYVEESLVKPISWARPLEFWELNPDSFRVKSVPKRVVYYVPYSAGIYGGFMRVRISNEASVIKVDEFEAIIPSKLVRGEK